MSRDTLGRLEFTGVFQAEGNSIRSARGNTDIVRAAQFRLKISTTTPLSPRGSGPEGFTDLRTQRGRKKRDPYSRYRARNAVPTPEIVRDSKEKQSSERKWPAIVAARLRGTKGPGIRFDPRRVPGAVV